MTETPWWEKIELRPGFSIVPVSHGPFAGMPMLTGAPLEPDGYVYGGDAAAAARAAKQAEIDARRERESRGRSHDTEASDG